MSIDGVDFDLIDFRDEQRFVSGWLLNQCSLSINYMFNVSVKIILYCSMKSLRRFHDSPVRSKGEAQVHKHNTNIQKKTHVRILIRTIHIALYGFV